MGLPPTSSKLSTDTSNVTTFFYDFPNFTGTHTGVTVSLGTNSVQGGGTGLSLTTPNELILAGSTSTGAFQQVPAVSLGYVLTDNGIGNSPTFQPSPGTISSFFASSKVTTASTPITSNSPTFTTFSNSPSFTFTPGVTGTYKVYCPLSLFQQNANAIGIVRIFNTSGGAVLLYESMGQGQTTGQILDTAFCQSVYTLTSGTNYVFDIQGANANASGSLIASGNFTPFYMFAELEVTATSSVGVSSLNALTGGLNIVAGTGISVTPSGSSITVAATGSSSTLDSQVWVTGQAALGSVGTAVLTFPTTISTSGTDITYVRSTTNGDTFTINTTGTYSITQQTAFNNAVALGPTANGSTTVAPSSQTIGLSGSLCYASVTAASDPWVLSITLPLPSGTVIRAGADPTANVSSGSNLHQFSITRVN